MSQFPSGISCTLIRGNSDSFTPAKRYLGNNRNFEYEEIKVSIRIGNENNYKTFSQWYFNTLKHGTESFTINLSAYGVKRDWLVRFSSQSRADLSGEITRIMPVTLLLLEDVADFI